MKGIKIYFMADEQIERSLFFLFQFHYLVCLLQEIAFGMKRGLIHASRNIY